MIFHFLFILSFCFCISAFQTRQKWCNLKTLVTWVGPLNLSRACAIFSVSTVPQPCPAHSLQFVRFRHISASEIVPPHRRSTSGSWADILNLRLTGWLTDWLGLFGISREGLPKHAGLQRHVREAPSSPRSPAPSCHRNFHWKCEQSRDVPLSCSKQSTAAVMHCVSVVTLHQYKEFSVWVPHWFHWLLPMQVFLI